MRLLDVGCGWGSLILHAAEHYGVHATGITLSAQQRDFVAKRIADRGLADRVEVRLQDYRELADAGRDVRRGQLDRDGRARRRGAVPDLRRRSCSARCKPTGRLLLQQMSRHRGTAPGGGAFIESYIAPDMHMRPMSADRSRICEDAGFEVRDVEAMREHYVTHRRATGSTRSSQRWDEFVALVGEEVARVWRLYLVGGALSFEEGRMGVDQFLAVKPADGGVSACRRRGPGLSGTWSREFRRVGVAANVGWCAAALARRARATFVVVQDRRQAQRHRHRVGAAVLRVAVVGLRPLVRVRRRRCGAGCCSCCRCSGGCGWRCTSAGARSASPRTRATSSCSPRPRAIRTCTRCARSTCCRALLAFVIAAPILVGAFEPRPVRRRRLGRRRGLGGRACSSRPSATRRWSGGGPIRRTRARSSTSGCGATPGTRTTSATPACGGGSSSSPPTRGRACVTVFAPVLMTLLLTKGSGARILEQHMCRREGWDEYAARTSMFFPLPPKKTVDALSERPGSAYAPRSTLVAAVRVVRARRRSAR